MNRQILSQTRRQVSATIQQFYPAPQVGKAEQPTARRKPAARGLLALDLVERVLAQTRAILPKARLNLVGDTALGADFGAIVQITGLGALKPHIFTSC